WIGEAGHRTVFDQRVAVADAARVHLDAHRACTGIWNGALRDLERTVRTGNLDDSHVRHGTDISVKDACANSETPFKRERQANWGATSRGLRIEPAPFLRARR